MFKVPSKIAMFALFTFIKTVLDYFDTSSPWHLQWKKNLVNKCFHSWKWLFVDTYMYNTIHRAKKKVQNGGDLFTSKYLDIYFSLLITRLLAHSLIHATVLISGIQSNKLATVSQNSDKLFLLENSMLLPRRFQSLLGIVLLPSVSHVSLLTTPPPLHPHCFSVRLKKVCLLLVNE